ncbi:DUF3037 domain-containing protein [Actinophytocola sediminis]
MPHVYEYALVRAVPRQERGEYMNVGAIVYCATLRYLSCRTHLDPVRLGALDPALDLDVLADALRALGQACAAGPAAENTPGQRFRWLTAPRSTIVQTSPTHTGFTEDPEAELDRLMGTQVMTRS